MKEVKLALLGYGNAGRAFCGLLAKKKDEIKRDFGADIKVTAIATKNKGTVLNPQGIDLGAAEADIKTFGKFQNGIQMDALTVAQEAEYDVLLELTPLDIFSGQPATDHIKAALERGKHAVSANKGPIAWAFRMLKELAQKNGCLFLYETTVMDGAPVFNLVAETLKMCKVTGISGILNSTTNFVLEELAKGLPYEEALAEGKRRGFVEADPSLDMEGWDAAAKVAALMNALMDADITPQSVHREGITGITAERIAEAKSRGKVIKLLCSGEIAGGHATGSVRPAELDQNHLLAGISGTSSAVSITTDLMGTISVIEHDPEIAQTAYGIFSDMLRVVEAK